MNKLSKEFRKIETSHYMGGSSYEGDEIQFVDIPRSELMEYMESLLVREPYSVELGECLGYVNYQWRKLGNWESLLAQMIESNAIVISHSVNVEALLEELDKLTNLRNTIRQAYHNKVAEWELKRAKRLGKKGKRKAKVLPEQGAWN